MPEPPSQPPDSRLRLKGVPPLAAGRERWVFAHPGEAGLIVKVPRPDRPSDQLWWRRLFYRRNRYGYYARYLLEVQEHLAAQRWQGETPAFLQKLHGFADTDLGLGLVFRAERGPDGKLAPSLRRLLRGGRFNEAMAAALRDFLRWLLACPVVEGDLTPGNLVYVAPSPGWPNGHFVLIDGVGGLHAVSPRRWLPFWNRWQKIRHVRRFREEAARCGPADAERIAAVVAEAMGAAARSG